MRFLVVVVSKAVSFKFVVPLLTNDNYLFFLSTIMVIPPTTVKHFKYLGLDFLSKRKCIYFLCTGPLMW